MLRVLNQFMIISIFVFSAVAMDKPVSNCNASFFTWTLSQGIFESMPLELRKKIMNYAIQKHIELSQLLIRESIIPLSLHELVFYNKNQLHGIRVLNAAFASDRYDLHWKLGRCTCYVPSYEDYNNACVVPTNIKMRFREQRSQKQISSLEIVRIMVKKEGNYYEEILKLE